MKSKQITDLCKKEMEMEDMLSSSEDMSEESKITDRNNGTDINECNLPFQIGLGGVIIKGNGEPLELTTSAKWDSNYDDTNSLVSLVFNDRKIQGFLSLHTIILRILTQTIQLIEM